MLAADEAAWENALAAHLSVLSDSLQSDSAVDAMSSWLVGQQAEASRARITARCASCADQVCVVVISPYLLSVYY